MASEDEEEARPPLEGFLPLRPRPKGNRDEIRVCPRCKALRSPRKGCKVCKGRGKWISPPDAILRHQNGVRRLAMLMLAGARGPWAGPVALDVDFVFQVPASWPKWKRQAALEGRLWPSSERYGDRDNLEKLLGDALKGVLFADDSRIVDGRVRKVFGEESGYRLRVEFLQEAKRGD